MDWSPIPRADSFNVSAPGANTDILSAAITPVYYGAFRITVSLTTGSVFNYTEARSGTTFTHGINSSVALNAGDAYIFNVDVSPLSTYNFQVETNSVIRQLKVSEIPSAVI